MTLPRYSAYRDSGVEWLGEVPAHWTTVRLGALFREAVDEGCEGLPILSVSIHDGVSDRELGDEEMDRKVTRSDDATKYRRVEPGDLVYNMMRAWQGGFGTVTVSGMVSPAYVIARPTTDLATSFVEQLLRTSAAVEEMRRLSKGVTDFRLRLYWDEFKTLKIAIPSEPEQASIAAFLGRETAKIDGLIAEQERLIELLAEKRRAVVSHAVTKGLDPNAPLKDSGIAWLGEVPAHWEMKRLKHMIRQGTSITYGIVQAGPHFDGGIPYIRTSDMSGSELPIEGYALTSPEIDAAYSRSKVDYGDLVIAIRATVGKCLPVPYELRGANLTQGTARIAPGENVDRDFLLEFLNSKPCQVYFDTMAKGATFREITLDALRQTPVVVPSIHEQGAIAELVRQFGNAFDALTAEATRAVALLKERRAALISAAVTGKIDVRGLVEEAA